MAKNISLHVCMLSHLGCVVRREREANWVSDTCT